MKNRENCRLIGYFFDEKWLVKLGTFFEKDSVTIPDFDYGSIYLKVFKWRVFIENVSYETFHRNIRFPIRVSRVGIYFGAGDRINGIF